MAVAENDVPPFATMVIPIVRVIFILTLGVRSRAIVRVVNDPQVGRAPALVEEIVLGEGCVIQAVGVTGDEVLGFALVGAEASPVPRALAKPAIS